MNGIQGIGSPTEPTAPQQHFLPIRLYDKLNERGYSFDPTIFIEDGTELDICVRNPNPVKKLRVIVHLTNNQVQINFPVRTLNPGSAISLGKFTTQAAHSPYSFNFLISLSTAQDPNRYGSSNENEWPRSSIYQFQISSRIENPSQNLPDLIEEGMEKSF